jgi:hypothetical protein
MIEEWKDVQGYEGYYCISSFGRVRSLERIVERKDGRLMRIKQRIMTITINKSSPCVSLCKESVLETVCVNQLLKKHFKKNIQRKVGYDVPSRCLATLEQVKYIRKEMSKLRHTEFHGFISEISKEMSLKAGVVSSIVHGRTWKSV